VGDVARFLVLIVSFALFAVPFNTRWLLQGMEKMAWVSLAQFTRMSVFLVAVLLLVTTGSSLALVGVIEVTAAFAVAVYFLFFQLRLGIPFRFNFNMQDMASVTRKARTIGVGQIVWSFNQNLPTMIIVWFVGTVELAWYGAALRFVNALVSFSMLYHFNIYPTVVRRLKNSAHHYQELSVPSVRICAWAGVFVVYVGVLIPKPLCELTFGTQYTAAALPLSVLIWTIPLTLISGHARWALIAADKQKYVMFAQILGCLTSIMIGLILIPKYHATGGSIAMVASAFVVWLVAQYFACTLVTPVPYIQVINPFSLAMFLLAINTHYQLPQLSSTIILIFTFLVLAPIVDSRLLRDVPALMRIKSEAA